MRIKIFILGTLMFLTRVSLADFGLGLEYYNQKNYEKAFKEFEEAAKNGDYDAQFNLAVMHLKGESITKDLPTAYAWFKLAAQSKTYEEKATYKKIYAKLNDAQKKVADKTYKIIETNYNDLAVFNKLQPKLISNNATQNQRIIRIVTPEYPQSAFRSKETIGWVDTIFSIDKDGTTRDHMVFFSSNEAFKKTTLEAIRGFLWEPTKVNGKPVVVNGIRYRLNFTLHGTKYDNKSIQDSITEYKDKAISGTSADEFNYAYFISSIPSFTKEVKIEDNPNTWYLNAANKGYSAASYLLGANLLNGNMCTPDAVVGANWLIKASQNNLSDAQYLLAIELFSGARIEKNEAKGFYWLKRAAIVSDIAKLRLAWILSTNTNETYRDNKLATEYFEKVPKDHADKQTYFRTVAAIAANNNDFKNAIKWQKKAIKDAKKLELPLDTVNAQLASYQNNQPWREEP
jgi:uncharacterized protein